MDVKRLSIYISNFPATLIIILQWKQSKQKKIKNSTYLVSDHILSYIIINNQTHIIFRLVSTIIPQIKTINERLFPITVRVIINKSISRSRTTFSKA